METWEIIKKRWDEATVNLEGEKLFRFARNDILDLVSKIESLTSELKTTDEILEARYQVMRAIPECEAHGWNCVPHALTWIEQAKVALDEKRQKEGK